jgi:hypothetical protein
MNITFSLVQLIFLAITNIECGKIEKFGFKN